jgi:hypothetical protein
VWPENVNETAYVKQTWSEGRLLVWAHPGSKDRELDPTDPKNWLENSKPADRLFDAETDILFPDAETPCFVGTKGGRSSRQGHNPAGEGPAAPIARFKHVVMPHPGMVTRARKAETPKQPSLLREVARAGFLSRAFAVRHLTIGRNARVSIMPLTTHGNV